MRRSATMLAVLATSFIAPLSFAESVRFAEAPLCARLAETGQVQCSGTLAGLGQAPTHIEVTAPYHCASGTGYTPPELAFGYSSHESGGDMLTFQVSTQPASCKPAGSAVLGSQVSFKVRQGAAVVLEQNIPATPAPPR